MKESRKTYIYYLFDPRKPDTPRYVGYTISPKYRLSTHRSPSFACNDPLSAKNEWIRALSKDGLRPEMEILETTTWKDRNEREIYWVSYFGGKEKLLNETGGGYFKTFQNLKIFPPSRMNLARYLLAKYKIGIIEAPNRYSWSHFGMSFENLDEKNRAKLSQQRDKKLKENPYENMDFYDLLDEYINTRFFPSTNYRMKKLIEFLEKCEIEYTFFKKHNEICFEVYSMKKDCSNF